MSKRIRFFTLFLWLTAVAFPAFAQDHADSLHACPCSDNMAAFDLPWLAKYYGFDWTADSIERAKAEAQKRAGDERVAVEKATKTKDHALSLRANLLRWATLTPDLGLEWRIHPSWGILVNGSWTSWSWNGKDRRYALWEVAPEVRYYMGREKRGYLGAMFKAGQFNYKFSGTGCQGDLMGGGITGGYLLRLNDALSLDFSLALGYLNADYERYEVVDGVRVRRGNGAKNWWGPVNAGVTLVWTLF